MMEAESSPFDWLHYYAMKWSPWISGGGVGLYWGGWSWAIGIAVFGVFLYVQWFAVGSPETFRAYKAMQCDDEEDDGGR